MGFMDLFNQGDIRDKLYAAAEKSNIPQGGVTGAAFHALFPQGLGNMLFGRNPEPVPALNTPQGTQYMADLAQNMAVPGTFIGPKGMSNLMGDDVARGLMSSAEAKLAQGVPREEVFRELGVFKGPEGKWRYEIDDTPSYINKNRFERGVGEGIDGEYAILNHDELSRAYPEFSGIDFHRAEGSGSGSFREGVPATDEYFGQSPEIRINASDMGQARSTGLHELQHAVQGREGFAAGGSPQGMARLIENPLTEGEILRKSDVLNELLAEKMRRAVGVGEPHQKYSRLSDDGLERGIKSIEEELKNQNPIDMYNRLAGEAESREVQGRMNMDMVERRSLFPNYATRTDLIIRGLMNP